MAVSFLRTDIDGLEPKDTHSGASKSGGPGGHWPPTFLQCSIKEKS